MKVWGHGYQNIGAVNNRSATFQKITPIKVIFLFFFVAGPTERPFCICSRAEKAQPSVCLLWRTLGYWKLRRNNTTLSSAWKCSYLVCLCLSSLWPLLSQIPPAEGFLPPAIYIPFRGNWGCMPSWLRNNYIAIISLKWGFLHLCWGWLIKTLAFLHVDPEMLLWARTSAPM